ncbi:hypothetical protein MRB53_041331 [Persea americana]|nr:hypothetical protein MRB53_041331 [Persea americana]
MASFSNTDTGSKPADPYTAKNTQEPSLKEKVEDFIKFASNAKFCLLTTKTNDGLLASRAMAVASKENNDVDLIFHTNTESGKTDDIEANSEVNVGFLTSSGEWASVSGTASVVTDRAQVEQHYSPALKAWLGDLGDGKHDGGPQDPRIGLIKVHATTITYALSTKSMIGSAIELVKGVIQGEPPAINKLRYVTQAELQQYRSL